MTQTKLKGAEEEVAKLGRDKEAAEDKLHKIASELEGALLYLLTPEVSSPPKNALETCLEMLLCSSPGQ